jgi:hypothetical protein
MKKPRWLPDPYRRFAPPPPPDGPLEPDDAPEEPEPPREFTPEERAIQRRARMQVLLIAGLAVGGIICMMATTALVLWGLSR